jgi:hypothetical protein
MSAATGRRPRWVSTIEATATEASSRPYVVVPSAERTDAPGSRVSVPGRVVAAPSVNPLRNPIGVFIRSWPAARAGNAKSSSSWSLGQFTARP